jgi:hypothetical protein
MNARHVTWLLALLFSGLVALPAQASTKLKLRKSFIEANRDRATLTASFVVGKAHDNPKPEKEDGDWNPPRPHVGEAI